MLKVRNLGPRAAPLYEREVDFYLSRGVGRCAKRIVHGTWVHQDGTGENQWSVVGKVRTEDRHQRSEVPGEVRSLAVVAKVAEVSPLAPR
jgi:hypothetical protein